MLLWDVLDDWLAAARFRARLGLHARARRS